MTELADKLARSYRHANLIPAHAHVRVWMGELLLAQTTDAFVTAHPDVCGLLLIPLDAVEANRLATTSVGTTLDGLMVEGTADIIGWRLPIEGGPSRITFDPDKTRIEMTDLRGQAPDDLRGAARFPRWGDMTDLVDQVDVLTIDELHYQSRTYGDLRRNVVEGSQILAQSIVAAARATPGQNVVSAHSIFSRAAGFDRPIDSNVSLVRRGRTFSTVSVEAVQDQKSIASSLLLLDKGAPDLIQSQTAMPTLPGPEQSPPYDFGVSGRDVRFVNNDYGRDADWVGPPEIHAWIRYREAPSETCLQQALIAQFTGHMTVAAALLPHKGLSEDMAHVTISTAILSITVNFHNAPDLSDWLLYTNPVIHAGGGLAQGVGRIFTRGGVLLASYSVQAMVRDFDRDPSAMGGQERLL